MDLARRLVCLLLHRLLWISSLRSWLLLLIIISHGSLRILNFTSSTATHWLSLLAAVLSSLLATHTTDRLLLWLNQDLWTTNRSSILMNTTSTFLFLWELQIKVTFCFSSFCLKVFLSKDWRHNCKFSCLSLNKCFRDYWFRILRLFNRINIYFWWCNPWWNRLSSFWFSLINRFSRGWSSNLYCSSKKSSSVHLTKLRLIASGMWVDIVSLKFLIHICRISVGITIRKECWLSKVSGNGWVRKLSRG